MIKTVPFYPLVFFLGCLLLTQASCDKAKPEPPNIIFIFADDQSYNTVHAHGNTEIITPNIDRLAEEGTSFSHAYNMGAWGGAVCVASRAMMNTGRFVWRARPLTENLDSLAAEGSMWSQVMHRAGYETYFSGKWHVRVDPEKIFDNVVHIRPGMPKTVKEAYDRPHEGEEDLWSPFDTTLGGFWQDGKHWSEVLGDDAINFISRASDKKDPFFMYLAFNAPHDPRQSPEEFVNLYPAENLSIPQSFIPEYPFKDDIGCGEGLRDERLAPFPRTEYAVKIHRQEYYAIITHMDQQIGRILDALEKSGKADNTYIFFSADHGLAAGHHGFMGKQNMYDHSIRPPMIVVGPDIKRNQTLDMDVYLQDIMATSIDLAGVDIPEYVEFNSMLPLLKGEQKKSNYPQIYGCYRDLQRMIRAEGFKLIAYPRAGMVRLYDLENDPLELNDLSGDPERKDQISQLFADLVELGKAMDDELDLVSYFPEYRHGR